MTFCKDNSALSFQLDFWEGISYVQTPRELYIRGKCMGPSGAAHLNEIEFW